jgi:hypothetical protein
VTDAQLEQLLAKLDQLGQPLQWLGSAEAQNFLVAFALIVCFLIGFSIGARSTRVF